MNILLTPSMGGEYMNARRRRIKEREGLHSPRFSPRITASQKHRVDHIIDSMVNVASAYLNVEL